MAYLSGVAYYGAGSYLNHPGLKWRAAEFNQTTITEEQLQLIINVEADYRPASFFPTYPLVTGFTYRLTNEGADT